MSRNPASILYNSQGTNAISTVSGLNIERLAVQAELAQGAIFDAFGRLRTSQPQTIFDAKHVYDDLALFFSNKVTAGGTITRDANKSLMVLSTAGGATDRAIRQTKRYFPYQPGKSQLYLATFNFINTATNITKRVGLYDNNNGIFLEQAGTALNIVIRSDTSGSVVNTTIPRSSWNEDKFDGTGKSGLTLDFTKVQIICIDFEWLGAGQIRLGFFINGQVFYAHKIGNHNTITEPYMRTPDLPIRYEIESTGTSSASTMYAICSTVMSEGGFHLVGHARSVNRGIVPLSTDNTLRPLISIRLSSGSIRESVFPFGLSIINSTTANFFWTLRLNPTITGGTSPNWLAIADSAVESDIARTGVLSGGTEIMSGYGSAKLDSAISDISLLLPVGATVDGISDEVVLGVQSIGNQTEDFFGSISWVES